MDHRATPNAQPQNAAADAVERVIAQLDRLVRDMRLGNPSHAASERHADIARVQAQALDDAFRKPATSARLVNPPKYLSADGTRAVW